MVSISTVGSSLFDTGHIVLPGDPDGRTVSVYRVQPFVDPINTFRAQSLRDMFSIVPDVDEFSAFKYDVGLPPERTSFIVSIQNKTVNTVLRCNLTLPPYLRSNLGTVFDIPFINDTTTDTIFLPTTSIQPKSVITHSGKGLINVTITFHEPQAMTVLPPGRSDQIIFDIFPRDPLTGPVFVSTTIEDPRDLNDEDPDDVPIDDDPIEPEEPEDIIEIPVIVTESVELPSDGPAWISGVDGQLRQGSPPSGWTTQADGRAYPPLPEPDVCDEKDPTGGGANGDEEGTPLEQLLAAASNISPSFGTSTRRRGYIIDPSSFITGVQTNRITQRLPLLLVADSVPGDTRFKIVLTDDTFKDGSPVPNPTTDETTRDYLELTNLAVSLVKEGETLDFDFDRLREWGIVNITKKVIDEGERLDVEADLSAQELQSGRIIATAVSIIREIQSNGEGSAVESRSRRSSDSGGRAGRDEGGTGGVMPDDGPGGRRTI